MYGTGIPISSLIAAVLFFDVAMAILSHFIVNQITQRTVNNRLVRVLSWIMVFVGGVFLVTVLGFLVWELIISGTFFLRHFAPEFIWILRVAIDIWFDSLFTHVFVWTLIFGTIVQIREVDVLENPKKGKMRKMSPID